MTKTDDPAATLLTAIADSLAAKLVAASLQPEVAPCLRDYWRTATALQRATAANGADNGAYDPAYTAAYVQREAQQEADTLLANAQARQAQADKAEADRWRAVCANHVRARLQQERVALAAAAQAAERSSPR